MWVEYACFKASRFSTVVNIFLRLIMTQRSIIGQFNSSLLWNRHCIFNKNLPFRNFQLNFPSTSSIFEWIRLFLSDIYNILAFFGKINWWRHDQRLTRTCTFVLATYNIIWFWMSSELQWTNRLLILTTWGFQLCVVETRQGRTIIFWFHLVYIRPNRILRVEWFLLVLQDKRTKIALK